MRTLGRMVSMLCFIIVFASCGHQGAWVEVFNKSEGMIRNVTVIYAGGTKQLGDLEPLMEKGVRVWPEAGKGITVSYTDSLTKPNDTTLDVSYGTQPAGTVVLLVKKEGAVEWSGSWK